MLNGAYNSFLFSEKQLDHWSTHPEVVVPPLQLQLQVCNQAESFYSLQEYISVKKLHYLFSDLNLCSN